MTRLFTFVTTTLLASLALAQDKPAEPPKPKSKFDLVASAKLAAGMPKVVSGLVTLDGKPLANVRVTDGIGFVATGADGRYSIEIKHDDKIPYLPARTVNVCWPSGCWPVRDPKTKQYRWWTRLMDIKDAKNVNFEFATQPQTLPVCIGFGTDPHDALKRPHNTVYADEIARAGNHVAWAVMNGDLGYLTEEGCIDDYTNVKKYTDDFPVPLMQVIGNHDLVGIGEGGYDAPHELAGQGGFTKYLGPTRWSFDYAGVHFVAFNWPMVDKAGEDWLCADMDAQPKDRPIYLFIHMWDKFLGPIIQKRPNVKLVLAGHSHRNIFAGVEGKAEFWTKMSLYTLLYVEKDDFDIVDNCVYEGARTAWDGWWGHHGGNCALHTETAEEAAAQRSKHSEAVAVTLDSKTQTIEPPTGKTYDLRIGAKPTGSKPAARWGLRLTAADGKTYEITASPQRKMINMLGRETFFDPKPTPGLAGKIDPKEQEWTEFRIFVQPEKVRVLVNSRLHYQKYITPGELKKIEFFAEDGAAEFGRVDVWQRTYPKDYKPRPMGNSG
ncbi:MAG: hypothetical protein LLG01_05300 [Planctomycetaceae bacterium]|nr:hypothetical protein [Planctomycetaceae bacterium]